MAEDFTGRSLRRCGWLKRISMAEEQMNRFRRIVIALVLSQILFIAATAASVRPVMEMTYHEQLPEPVCMASIVRLSERPRHKRNRILFANPHNPDDRRRRNLTVKLSYDEGESWPVTRSIEPGISGYSDLAVGADGQVYCFYERGSVDTSHYRPAQLTVGRFNLQWLTGGQDSLE